MLHKKQFTPNIIIFIFLAIFLTSCAAATRPYTIRESVPEGPPEYQAGWHDGCQSAFSTGAFYNARSKFAPNIGNGIYQHDSLYQTGFNWGFNICMIQNGNFGVSGGSFGGIIGAAPLE